MSFRGQSENKKIPSGVRKSKEKEIGHARGLRQYENTTIPITTIKERTETDIGILDF